MDAFFRRQQRTQQSPPPQEQRRRTNSQQHNHNPVMDFFRSVTGQGGIDPAAAAAQFGDFISENFQMPQQFMDQVHQPAPTGPPPASAAALRTLPTISVSAEDLVEPSNRECCICFEEHNIGDKVVRLPCAHIFHHDCITDWLSRHCTCPTCRYELPTEDPMYEAGRRQRMSTRKPRYAKYELERLSVRQLKDLLPPRRRSSSSSMFSDKSDLIDYLISNQIVDLISAPPPVEFPSLSVLRGMGVGKLKRTMNDTGVYFDPRDVVEKEDMVQIFVNSGRIILTDPGDETSSSGRPDTTYGHAPGTRQRSYSVDADREVNENHDNSEEDDNNVTMANQNNNSRANGSGGRSVVVETVGEIDEDVNSPARKKATTTREAWESACVLEETGFGSDFQSPTEDPTWRDEDDGTEVPLEEHSSPVQMDVDSQSPNGLNAAIDDAPPAAAAAARPPAVEDETETEWVDESEVPRKRERDTENAQPQPESTSDPYQRLSISQLRAMGRERGIDLSNCLERGEMIERIKSSTNGRQQMNGVRTMATGDASRDLALAVNTLQGWKSPQLQTCGKAIGIDLSHCTNADDMKEVLSRAAEDRSDVVKMILTLSPFMEMTIQNLRVQALVWDVNINDCIERGEMICRLAAKAVKRG